jgi:hypothetical protein
MQAKVPQSTMLGEGTTQVPLPSQARGRVATLPEHEPARHDVPAGCRRQPPAPSHVPSVPQVEAAVTAHTPLGSTVPLATGAQVPRLPVRLHARQDVQDAVPQHTPSTQLPLTHSGPAPQEAPRGFRVPHWPEAVSHPAGATQSAEAAHVFLQAFALPSHMYGAHGWVVPATHVPLPSHIEARVSVLVPAGHAAGAHIVPLACLRQAPAPSQVPSLPQEASLCRGQLPRGSGMPAGTLAHEPRAPGTLQAWHGPQVMARQQTPSVQLPLAQSEARAQVAPSGFSVHDPATHTLGATQS